METARQNYFKYILIPHINPSKTEGIAVFRIIVNLFPLEIGQLLETVPRLTNTQNKNHQFLIAFRIMKYLLRISLVLALLTTFGWNAQASHVAGGDITFMCNDSMPDSIFITAQFFRDCSGIPAPPSINLNGSNICGITLTPITLTLQNPGGTEVSQLCAGQIQLSTCGFGTFPGMQRYTYTGWLDLDALTLGNPGCTEWIFSYSVSARNSAVNAGGGNFYVETKFNNDDFPCNNSPVFTANPIPYVCVGQTVNYSFGAIEPDGDSLVFLLDTAQIGLNNPINYSGGYSAAQPIPGIVINQQTGQLTFTPAAPLGNYIVVVKVYEYEPGTGLLKSVTTRDIQVVFQTCNNIVPTNIGGISNLTGTALQLDSTTLDLCNGQSFTFDVIFTDFDTAGNISVDSIGITSNIATVLPGATFTTVGSNPVTATVSWTAVSIPGSFVTFNFFAQDDACPVFGIATTTYGVFVSDSTYLPPDTSVCSGDSIFLDANGGSSFTWTSISGDPLIVGQTISCDSCGAPTFNFTQTTVLAVQSNLPALCNNTDTMTITVFTETPIDIVDDSPYCVTEGIDSLSLAVIPSQGTGTWLGLGIVDQNLGLFAPNILNPSIGGDTTFQVIYNHGGNCPNSDTTLITVVGLPNTNISTPGPFCVNDQSIQLTSQVNNGGYWTGPGVTDTVQGTFDATQFTVGDTVTIFYTVDGGVCTNTDSLQTFIIGAFSAEIDSLPKICVGDETPILLNNYEGDPFGTWSGGEVKEEPVGSGSWVFDPTGLPSGTYPLSYAHFGSCGSQSTDTLIINKVPNTEIIADTNVFCDNIDDSVKFETFVDGGVWGGDIVTTGEGNFIPKEVGEGLYKVSYEIFDEVTTCYNKSEITVRIARTPPKPKIIDDSPFCSGYNLDNLRADGLLSNTFTWYNDNPWNDTVVPAKYGIGNPFNFGPVDISFPIWATQTSEFGCESPAELVVIDVIPSPIAGFTPNPPTGIAPLVINYNNISLGDTTGSTSLSHFWDFGDGFTETVTNPSHVFTELGIYDVWLYVDNGLCRDSVSYRITVDGKATVVIPNIFTPNGDGVNDKFIIKTEGINDYRFVIYNRWGTKVFETEDAEEAWDGDNFSDGVYYYVLTGTEQTLDEKEVQYQGSVTLTGGSGGAK